MKKTISILFLLISAFSLFAQSSVENRTLYVKKPRMQGEDVLYIQNKLIEMGFSELGVPDGIFDSKTEEAVKTFQIFAGFTPNGHVTNEIYDFFHTKNAKAIMDMINIYNEKKGAKKVIKRPDYKIKNIPDDQTFKVYAQNKDASYCSMLVDYDYYRGFLDVYKINDSTYMMVYSENYADIPEGANIWEHYSYEQIVKTTVYYLVNDRLCILRNGLFEDFDDKDIKEYISYCKKYL